MAMAHNPSHLQFLGVRASESCGLHPVLAQSVTSHSSGSSEHPASTGLRAEIHVSASISVAG